MSLVFCIEAWRLARIREVRNCHHDGAQAVMATCRSGDEAVMAIMEEMTRNGTRECGGASVDGREFAVQSGGPIRLPWNVDSRRPVAQEIEL